MAHPTRFGVRPNLIGVRWPASRALHAHDLNDGLAHLEHRLRQATDAQLRDGSVLQGGDLVIDPLAGMATAAAGTVYAAGLYLAVPERRDFAVPTSGTVRIGVCLTETVLTYQDEPRLRGEEPGARNFGEPGADRLEVAAAWAHEGEACGGGRFFAVYTVIEGEVLTPEPPTNPFDGRLARYDREARGHYIVSGWRVTPLGKFGADQHFSIEAGVINVWGYKLERTRSYRLIEPEAADLQRVEAEPRLIPADASGAVTIATAHSPIAGVHDVTVVRSNAASLTKGVVGSADLLPHQSVQAIVSVTQGGTTYQQGVDYQRDGDRVVWLETAGDEPAPGSSYSVVYHYYDTVAPDAWDDAGVTISDVVPGSTMLIDYDWALPRIDVIAVDRDGAVHYLKGEASFYRPIPPVPPLDWLAIAEVDNRWGRTPVVANIGTRAVHNTKLEVLAKQVRDLYDLVAQERLLRDMDSRQLTAKRGLFVDPFFDDDLRDQGLPQTAAVVDETLRLPIATTVIDRRLPEVFTLPYDEALAVEQPLTTGAMRINPYLSFAPLPARAHLDPAVDRWTETDTQWTSPVTERVTIAGDADGLVTRRSEAELLGVTTAEAELLRPRQILFEIAGFGAGEDLAGVAFDGVAVTPGPNPATGDPLTADAQGRLSGVFTIPEGIPAGAKRVTFEGQGGTRAAATYVGGGEVTTTQLRLVTTEIWTVERAERGGNGSGDGDDPLGQTFTLPSGGALVGVDFKFAALGDVAVPVVAQLRQVRDGVITGVTLAEAFIDPAEAVVGEWVAARFALPAPTVRGEEYAIVWMTDDPDHALALAGIGEFDAEAQRYVTSQPYLVGVLQSSSNNRSWTVHQTLDLSFRLPVARYSATQRVVPLGDPVALSGVTDLIVYAGVEAQGASARVLVRVTREDGEIILAAPGQRIQFAESVSEDVTIDFVLMGSITESPVLHRDVQIVLGQQATGATYISRAMPAGSAADPQSVVVTVETLIPSGGAVAVEVGREGDWLPMSQHSALPLGDGWVERTYLLTDYTQGDARIRLNFSGDAGARTQLRQLRANVTGDPVNIITGA